MKLIVAKEFDNLMCFGTLPTVQNRICIHLLIWFDNYDEILNLFDLIE